MFARSVLHFGLIMMMAAKTYWMVETVVLLVGRMKIDVDFDELTCVGLPFLSSQCLPTPGRLVAACLSALIVHDDISVSLSGYNACSLFFYSWNCRFA